MAGNKQDITGEWVEIAEKCEGGTIVFYRNGPNVPPARSRRQLHLKAQSQAHTEAPGPTDKSEKSGTGGWIRDGDILHIQVPGWEGEYDIKEVQDDTLILHRR